MKSLLKNLSLTFSRTTNFSFLFRLNCHTWQLQGSVTAQKLFWPSSVLCYIRMASNKLVCVTGANGFIASWIVCRLLQCGYYVRATVRDPTDEKKVGHLQKLEGASDRLTLLKADIMDYVAVKSAIDGCEGVFHTACPVAATFQDPKEVVDPALKGVDNVIRASAEAKVRRVVMTSSGAAVIADPSRPIARLDEECWSDADYCLQNKDYYSYAKTVSEKLAWKLSKDLQVDLVVILPALVWGPSLSPTLSATNGVIKQLLDGSSDTYANMYRVLVHVKDVADAHLLAYEKPGASGRYICCAEIMHMKDILGILKERFPQYTLPCKFPDELSGYLRPSSLTSRKLQQLGLVYTPVEQAITETVVSFQEMGIVN